KLCKQAVERLAFCAVEARARPARRSARPGPARLTAGRGPLDSLTPRRPNRAHGPADGALRAGRGRPRNRDLHLGRVLRLVPGDGEGAPQRRRRGVTPARTRLRARYGATPPPSLHALRDRGALVRRRRRALPPARG